MKILLEEKNKRFFDKFAKHYDKKLFKRWMEKRNKKIILNAEIKNN